MTSQPMIPRQLEAALREAIQAHADRHCAGTLDVTVVLVALGNLSGAYLGEFPSRQQSDVAFTSLGLRIAREMRQMHRARTSGSVARN
jgi:hypothetical protein